MSNIKSALALGAAIVALSAGGAFAAAGMQTEGSLNVMAGPGDNFKTIGRLEANADVSVLRHSGNWCRITAESLTGWVSCGQLTSTTPRTDTAPAVAQAWTGYNYNTDPIIGPKGITPFHPEHNGSFN